MTTLTRIELHVAPTAPLSLSNPTTVESIGVELGWDYAHYQLAPPAPYAQEPSPLRNGLLAGQAAFGARTLPATRHVRQWLQLRLQAWLRGRTFELFQVTPNYLQQIETTHCPITRAKLAGINPDITDITDIADASVDRVRNDAGYAAGNLAVMSTKANHAKAANDFHSARDLARQIDAAQQTGLTGLAGLTAAQWSRVAVLCSFVETLSHHEACALPLLVLPPNRLRLFNPVQALQAFVSQQLVTPGWSQRISRFEDLLTGKPLRRDFKTFFLALLPRVLEAGKLNDSQLTRWAIEDAWRTPLVQDHWTHFARQLTAAQCEALLNKAAARRLTTRTIVPFSDAGATDGWMLETRGYVPHHGVSHAPHQANQQAHQHANQQAPDGMQRQLAF